MRIAPLLCAASVLAMPVAAYAQQITSSIEGQVTNQSGAPVAGATVTVTDVRTDTTRTLITDANGRFATRGLTIGGPYTVSVSALGLQGQTVEGLVTSLEGATTLAFALDAAAAGEEAAIVVTGQRANVQLRAIGPGTAFGAETLANAPTFNRDVRDVIRIDPRVSLDRDDGGSGQDRISCLGGNDRGNTFTVDGIAQSDIYGLNDTGFSARNSTPLPYDAIRQTQVQFAPFDVEFGQFTGCAINVITRSGTNRIEASGFFEYSNSDLRSDSVDGRPVAPIEPEKRWGVSVGGPIIPDRLFFFGAYEHHQAGQSQDDGPAGAGYANELAGVPVAAFNQISEILSRVYGIDTGPLVTSRPFESDRYFGRLDWQITEDHRLELTYQRLEEASVRTDDFFATASSPQVTGANTFLRSGTNSNYYSGRLFSQWNDSFSTDIRYSRSEVIDVQDPVGGGEAQSANPIPRILVGIDNPGTIVDGAVLGGPGTSRSANDLQTTIEQYKISANIELGNHTLKIGGEINHANIFNLFVQNATGTLVFRNAADLEAGLLSPGTGNNSTSTLPSSIVGGVTEGAFGNVTPTGDVNEAAAAFTRNIYSVYVQDEWRASDSLNIVAGVRADWYDGGRPQNNPNFFQRYRITNNTGFSDIEPVILPRVGFTYDFAEWGFLSRAQIHGGAGIFSGGDPLVWFGNAFQNDGSTFALATTQAAGCPAGQIDVVVGGQFTGVPQCFQTAASATAAAGLGNTQAVDPDIKMPTVFRANIGLQSRLDFSDSGFFSNWRINLDYIYSQFRNPFTIVDLSQTPNPASGLSGYTIDGRPIYVTIDPTRAGCAATLVDAGAPPVWTGVTAPCITTTRFDELMLTNAGGYQSHVASILLSKDFEGGLITPGGGVSFNLGYAYTNSQDRRNMYNSTAGSNYDLTAAFDRQNPAASRGFYESRHNITLHTRFQEQFFQDYNTTFGFTFVARSGRPYSLTFTGGAIFNNTNSGFENALAYIPTGATDPNLSPSSSATAVADLVGFLAGIDCAQGYAGRTIARNTCTNDWFYDLDLSFSQEIPGPGRLFGRRDSFRLYAMVDNFLNLLDDRWNVHRRRNFSGLQDIARVSGVDAQGRYIISAFNPIADFNSDNAINVSSSVWRLKVGLSYRF